MGIFLLFIAFLYLFQIFLLPLNGDKKKIYVVCCCIFLFVIIGFRGEEVGTDTYSYMLSFFQYNKIYSFKLDDICEIFSLYQEPAYILLNICVGLFTEKFTIFLCCYASLYVVAIGYLVYKYSDKPLWSFIVLLSLGFVYFAMAGIRQTIAMSILLFSYKYIQERKVLPFILLVFLAYMFHNSSVIFLVAYPVATLKINWKHLVVLVCAYIIMAFFSELVRFVIFDLMKWERLDSYYNRTETLSLSGVIIQISIFAFAYFFKEDAIKYNKNNIILINMTFLGCLFQLYSTVIAEFFRVSMYFSIFNALMIPNIACSIQMKSNKKLVCFLIPVFLLAYYLIFSGPDPSIVPYYFASRTP